MRRKVRVPAESEKELGRAARQKKAGGCESWNGGWPRSDVRAFRFSTGGGDSYGVIPVF